MEEEDYSAYEIVTLERTASSMSTISMVRIISCTSANEEEIHRRINQKLLHFTDVFREVQRIAANIAEKLDLDEDIVLILLYNNKWDDGTCMDRYFNGDSSLYEELKRLKAIGIHKSQESKLCPVCLEMDMLIQSYCGHSCCRRCWIAHIQTTTSELKPVVSCIDHSCRIPLLHSFVMEQQPDSKQYLRCLSLSYVSSTKTLRFCPGVDC